MPLVVEQGTVRREEDAYAARGTAEHLALDARMVQHRHRIRTGNTSSVRLGIAGRGIGRPESRMSESMKGRTRTAKAECSPGDGIELERPTTVAAASLVFGAPAFAPSSDFVSISNFVGGQPLAGASKPLHGLEDRHAAVARH